jgi:hypothetical protein
MARTHQFKINIKSLAAEAGIIRAEVRKLRARRRRLLEMEGPERAEQAAAVEAIYRDLTNHRRGHLREHTRHKLLAYAAIRGVPYRKTESRCSPSNHPDFGKVRNYFVRFNGDNEGWKTWLSEAEAHLEDLDIPKAA